MKQHQVTIPNPCDLRWQQLDRIEHATDRHCSRCAMHIVDFTAMSDDEVIAYLATRKNQKVCGQLYSVDALEHISPIQRRVLGWYKQVSTNIRHHYSRSALLALVGVLAMATGCSPKTMGEPANPCHDELVPDTTTTDPNDSTYVEVCP